MVLDLVLHHDLRDQVHRFVDLRLEGLEVVAEGAGLLLGATLADAEMEASLGEDVEGRDPLGHLDGVVHGRGQADDTVTDVDAAGPARDEGEKRLRGTHVGVVRERGVLDGPDHVEAHLLRKETLLDRVLEDLKVARPRGVDCLRLVDQ